MIDKIAYEIVKSLSVNVDYVDRWTGLVRPMRKRVQNIEKVFPVAINTPENCNQSDYKALVPDNSKRSVVYVEKLGNPTVEMFRRHYKNMAAQLRIVCWYNLDMITEGAYVSEDVLVDKMLEKLPSRLSDSLFSGVSQVHIQPTSILYGAEIVSQYTYNEIKSQFVTHPYGIFAIDLDVWYISTHCQAGLGLNEGCVTGNGNHETHELPDEELNGEQE